MAWHDDTIHALVYTHRTCETHGLLPFMPGSWQHAFWGATSGHREHIRWKQWISWVEVDVRHQLHHHLVWGFLGLVMLPDYPNRPNPRAFWFNKKHGEMAIARLVRHKRAEPRPVTLASAKRTFAGWVVYFVAVLYAGTVLATFGYVYFPLFLDALKRPDGSRRWSVQEVNVIPTGGGAINVIFVWIWALLSDFLRTRWLLIVAQGLIGLIPCITMSIWTSHPNSTPLSAAYASYFINYVALGTAPLIFAWLSDLIPQDPEARSLIVGVAVASYYAISA